LKQRCGWWAQRSLFTTVTSLKDTSRMASKRQIETQMSMDKQRHKKEKNGQQHPRHPNPLTIHTSHQATPMTVKTKKTQVRATVNL
jgi:hypothetical protein